MQQINQQFGTADDGTPLWGRGYIPDGVGPFPASGVWHGGGMYAGDKQEDVVRCADLARAGYIAISFDYRLTGVEGRSLMAGQLAPAYYPAQMNDVRMAILALRDGTIPGIEGKVNGIVVGVGGSSGATLVCEACCTGTVGRDRLDAGVVLSGALELDDPVSLLKMAPPFDFNDLAFGYSNSTDPVVMRAASPISKFGNADIAPMLIVASVNDPVTPQQYEDAVNGPDGLIANGVTNFQSFLVTGANDSEHSFHYWDKDSGDGVEVRTKVIAFLGEAVATGPKGIFEAVVLGADGIINQISAAELARADLDGFGCGAKWWRAEPTEGVWVTPELDVELLKVKAAGKMILTRISGSGGPQRDNGAMPDFVADAIQAPIIWTGVVTGGTTLTSTANNATGFPAAFVTNDLGLIVTAPGWPNLAVDNLVPVRVASRTSASVIVLDTVVPNGAVTFCMYGRSFFTYAQTGGSGAGLGWNSVPAFFNPIFLAKKIAMIGLWGAHFTSLGIKPKIVSFSYANAQTDDWAVPNKKTVDSVSGLTDLDQWAKLGYTTTKMINAGKAIMDATAVAFPDSFLTTATGQMGRDLDKSEADIAGDPDISNYLPRTVCNYGYATYPDRFFTQVNSLAAHTPHYGEAAGTHMALMAEFHSQGKRIAAQQLWFVSGDTGYRMNRGDNCDHDAGCIPTPPSALCTGNCAMTDDQISRRTFDRALEYGMFYVENYYRDCVELVDATIYGHTLLTGGFGGDIEPPPPPPPGDLLPYTGSLFFVAPDGVTLAIATDSIGAPIVLPLIPGDSTSFTFPVPPQKLVGGRLHELQLAANTIYGRSDVAKARFTSDPSVIHIPKHTPEGIFALIDVGPLGTTGDLSGKEFWNKTFVDGVRFRTRWNMVEPTEGAFAWQAIDDFLALCALNNKFAIISISEGIYTPADVYAQGAIGFTLTAGPFTGTMPVPWDTIYRNRWKALIRAAAVRYDENVKLSGWAMSGLGQEIPSKVVETGDFNALRLLAIAAGYNNIVAGWQAGVHDTLNGFGDFRKTRVLFTLDLPVPTDAAPITGDDAITAMVDWAIPRLTDNFGMMTEKLTALSDGTDTLNALIFANYTTQPSGFRTLLPAIDATDLEDTLDAAIALGAHFIEVPEIDINNPAYATILNTARTGLHTNTP